MAASTFHHCQHCGYATDTSNSLSMFEENPYCRQCGLSASESESKMQDDLSDLMARNMHLSNNPIQPTFTSESPPTPQLDPQPAPAVAYITQHYHHSTHQVPISFHHETQPSQTLAEAGIDASVLFPSQLHLFKHAQPDQKLRLIELWRIAPPTYGHQMQAKNLGNWPTTNLAQEEDAAKHRWDRMSEQAKEYALKQTKTNAEPYMLDGYDDFAKLHGFETPAPAPQITTDRTTDYNRAHDPVYSSREWWQHGSEAQSMEHQYGMVEQMRIHGYGPVDMDGDKEML